MSTPSLWYYHKEARAFGPVEEADIGGLFARNEIAADTLVWRDGLSNWTEARSTELGGFFSDAGSPPPPVSIVNHDENIAGYFGSHPGRDIQLSYLRGTVIGSSFVI